jgi:hypothetical protein
MTHAAVEADMQHALAEVGELDTVVEVGTFLRVLA